MDINNIFKPNSDLKLIEQVRKVMRFHHNQYRTEQTYCDWITRFIKFHGYQKHPRDKGELEIASFLSHLASEWKVSASILRQAQCQGVEFIL